MRLTCGRLLLLLFVTLVFILPVQGQSLSETSPGWEGQKERELTFFGYFITRSERTNVFPSNDLMGGQTVGRLFGTNSTTTLSEGRASFVEQRLIPFFIYQPRVLNGRALLRAAFELDWTWGDQAYLAAGNFGGAISGSGVNLQTRNLEIELRLTSSWYLNIGLMRLYDTPRDLYRTMFSTLSLTGGRLAFWGTDATGATLNGVFGPTRYKLGVYTLYENRVQEDDDVSLLELAIDRHLLGTLHVGGSVRYLRDRANGRGGFGLGQGLNSNLNAYNGVYRFPFGATPYRAGIYWIGLESSANPELRSGRFGFSGFAVANLGEVQTQVGEDEALYEDTVAIRSIALNGRVGFRHGITPQDRITLEGIYTPGNTDGIEDGRFTSVLTGNYWGAPAAVYTSHELYLLMPHLYVVNRFTGAVADISNLGYGLSAAIATASKDLIPNRLRCKVGLGAGLSNVIPEGGGRFIGYEVNGMVEYQLRAFLQVGLHAARLDLGDFYDSALVNGDLAEGARPADPWTVFVALTWLMF